jgi:hypothetical protein
MRVGISRAFWAWILLALVSCGKTERPPEQPTQPPPPTAPTVAPPHPMVELSKRLAEPGWEVVKNPIGDMVQIPQSTAYTYSPDQALGMLWGLKAPGSTLCKDAKAEALQSVPLGRFVESDRARCRLKAGNERKVYAFRIEESAAASLQVGAFVDANINGKRAFEVQIAQPAQASFENDDACLPLEAILKLRLTPDQSICGLRWARAAVLTTITWRSFVEADGDTTAAYVIVKVGGKLYSSSEEFKETPILAGNYTDLLGRVPYDKASGAVSLGDPATPPTPAAEVRAVELPKALNVNPSLVPLETDRIFDKIRKDPDFKPLMRDSIGPGGTPPRQ